MYDKTLLWASHRHAERYLAALSFAESSFFPIPPDFMLAPMALSSPHKAYRYALLTTVCSVLGGIFGYAIGLVALEAVAKPFIVWAGYQHGYETVMQWFGVWGYWAIFIAGFTPIPYKLFTIAAGAFHFPLLPFVLISTMARGGRFFLVSTIIRLGGKKMADKIRLIIDSLGWLLIALFGGALIGYWIW